MDIKNILEKYKKGEKSIDDVILELKMLPFKELDIDDKIANIDYHRKIRQGYSEVIYGESKTAEDIVKILDELKGEKNILITRVSEEKYEEISNLHNVKYYEKARIVVANESEKTPNKKGYILVITAGTSDIPVAEEAFVTAKTLGNDVEKLYDVGVAGIHRIFNNLEKIVKARVIITVAGMEGALTSVIAGLVDCPVIAVPTSVGYGVNQNGITTLFSMLSSCSSGVSVVNIDNGFGAGYLASMINKM